NAEEQHITSGSVIYKAIEDNLWIEKDELKDIIKKVVSFTKKRIVLDDVYADSGATEKESIIAQVLYSLPTGFFLDSGR
ncbi:35187_t:CDS:2, partial [Racocetra persica]